MTEKLLLEIIVFQLGALLLLVGCVWRSHEKKHDSIEEKIEHLNDQRDHCSKTFASKEAVARAHSRLDIHDEDIVELKTSFAKIQSCGGKP